MRTTEVDWKQVENVFQAVHAMPPAERSAALLAKSGGDRELRREVESLLRADCDTRSLIRRGLSGLRAPATHPPIPEVIDRYEVLGEIGRGGMGTVLLAQRADTHYQQRVAIKLIRPGLDNELLLERFCQERQILAQLEHPGIARLLDGGALPDGRPYLVMEYIEGEPIDVYCDRRQLSVDERLGLLRQICEAVHYAHRTLVLHLDLKPNNILVDRTGRPRLLDFGTAQLLAGKAAREDQLTNVGLRPMTPAYASPEQLGHEPATTASDVYSLGLVLYRLLTARGPFGKEQRGPRARRHARPLLPSQAAHLDPLTEAPYEHGIGQEVAAERATTLPRLVRRLRGDLDSILTKALHRTPEQRYPTAWELAEDLRRHLSRLPVSTRADRLGYRQWRFLRRHRAASITAFLAALILIVAAVISVEQANVANEALANAEEQRAATEEVSRYLMDLFRGADPTQTPGGQTAAVGLLERGERLLGSLREQPQVRSKLQRTIGVAYHRLGHFEPATRHLDAALATLKNLPDSDSTSLALTLIERGILAYNLGDWQGAETLFREHLQLRLRYSAPDQPPVTSAKLSLGIVLVAAGDLTAGEQLLRQSLQRIPEQFGEKSIEMGRAAGGLGAVYLARGDLTKAIPMLRHALELARLNLDPLNPLLGGAMTNLAQATLAQGALEETEHLTREALALWHASLPQGHPSPATGYDLLGRVAHARGDTDTAEKHLRDALEVWRSTTPAAGDARSGQLALAELLVQTGRAAEAEPMLREVVVNLEHHQLYWTSAKAKSVLGECLVTLGQLGEAETLLRPSYRRLRAQLGADHAEVLKAEQRLRQLEQARRLSNA